MSFTLPDLVIESVLREGFKALKQNPNVIDHVFSSLVQPHISKKYGERELRRIKETLFKTDWSFVHTFAEVESKTPCVSIQLGAEQESRDLTHLEDLNEEATRKITDPDKLADLVRVTGIFPTLYDFEAGIVYVDDGANLSSVYANLIFVDASGNEFKILGGIVNSPGQKQFMVEPRSEVDISDAGLIKSGIDFEQFSVRGTHSDIQVLLGIHSKDALVTRYMYILVKFILLARKEELIRRNLLNMAYQGSDFARSVEYRGDQVYTRYLTVSGKVEDTWNSDKATIFDNVEAIILVPKDTKTTEDLERENQTIQVGPTYQGD